MVTANVDGDEQVYRAVFSFEVGYTGFGFWPIILLLLLAIQLQYLFMSGRIKRWRAKHAAAAVLLALLMPINDAAADEWHSKRNIFTVSYESSIDPIAINQMHYWVLSVTRDGEPVSGAEISVTGGMPAHDHGMPTRPRVTEELGGGRYKLDGLRFHMNGSWEMVIEINTDDRRDTVVILLEL